MHVNAQLNIPQINAQERVKTTSAVHECTKYLVYEKVITE